MRTSARAWLSRLRGVVAIVLVLAGLGVVSSAGAHRVAHGADPIRVLLVGDSVTHGSSGDWTWRYRLWQHLDEHGVAVDLVGPRHDVYDQIAQQPGSNAYIDPDFDRDHASRWGMSLKFADNPIEELVETYQPDVVVVMLGTNDLIAYDRTPEQAAGDLATFVTEARDAEAGVDIVVSHLTQTWFTGIPELNTRIDDLAADLDDPGARVVVADSDADYVREADTYDDSHASATGEVKIAAAVADALSVVGVGPPATRPLPTVPLGPRLPAPVSARVLKSGAVDLDWTRSPGALTHQLTMRVGATAGWRLIADQATGTTWRLLDVPRDRRLTLRVLPRKGRFLATPEIGSTVVVRVPKAVPSRPRPRVAVTPGGSVRVQWPRVRRASAYVVRLEDLARDRRRVVSNGDQRRVTVRDLRPGATYRVRVVARNVLGHGPSSRPLRVLIPAD